MIKNNHLKRRICEISYSLDLSHLGSCLTAVDIIDEIYSLKKSDEKFILSAGHAHLAHAVVMEKYKVISNAQTNIEKYGIHCNRKGGCDCSTGSLGQGLPIAVGMALADRSKMCYTLISDGECSEGSIWEALRIVQEQNLTNLKIYLNFNQWGAYKFIQDEPLLDAIKLYDYANVQIKHTNVDDFPILKGQGGHYKTLSEEEYQQCLEILKEDL